MFFFALYQISDNFSDTSASPILLFPFQLLGQFFPNLSGTVYDLEFCLLTLIKKSKMD